LTNEALLKLLHFAVYFNNVALVRHLVEDCQCHTDKLQSYPMTGARLLVSLSRNLMKIQFTLRSKVTVAERATNNGHRELQSI
jgi:hypothetical protein